MSSNMRLECLAGVRQTRKAVAAGSAGRVLLARDADPVLTRPLETLCRAHGVSVDWIGSMKELGAMCALKVGAAAAFVPLSHGFSGEAR